MRRPAILNAVAASSLAAFTGVAYAAGSHWTVEPTPVSHAPSGSPMSVSCVPVAAGPPSWPS